MWVQGPAASGLVISTQDAYDGEFLFYSELADDFMAYTDEPIVAVEWWGGTWCGPIEAPEAFVIRFYEEDPDPGLCQPGTQVYGALISQYVQEPYMDPDRFYYRVALEAPFVPEAGQNYWLSVQARMVFPPQWGWMVCDEQDYWGCEAVLDFAEIGVDRWTPLSETPPGEYYELAFGLYSPRSAVEADLALNAPRLMLLPVTPNPVLGETRITYRIPFNDASKPVRLRVCDTAGRVVRTLVDEVLTPGIHTVAWHGTDGCGADVPAGIYYCHLEAGTGSVSRKVLVAR